MQLLRHQFIGRIVRHSKVHHALQAEFDNRKDIDLSKEQIVDSLCPNRDWVPAAKMFHSRLYRVRQVTGPSSIEYLEGFYKANRGLAVWTDDAEFEYLIRAASHTTDSLGIIELLSRAMESCGN